MKIESPNNVNFGVIKLSDKAAMSLARRLPEKKFAVELPRIVANHKNNPVNINVDTIKNSDRLVCCIKIPQDNGEQLLYEYTNKESIIEKIFFNPINFLKGVCFQANAIADYLKHHN